MTKPLRVAVAGMGTMGRLYAGWMQQGRVPGAVFSAAYDPPPTARPACRKGSRRRNFSAKAANYSTAVSRMR